MLATTRPDCVVRLIGAARRVLATTRLGLIIRLVVAVACLGYTLGLLTVLLERLTIRPLAKVGVTIGRKR